VATQHDPSLHEYFDVDLEIRESTPNRADESPDRAVPSYQISVCVVGNVFLGEELADRLKASVGDEGRVGFVADRSK